MPADVRRDFEAVAPRRRRPPTYCIVTREGPRMIAETYRRGMLMETSAAGA